MTDTACFSSDELSPKDKSLFLIDLMLLCNLVFDCTQGQ